MTRCPMRYVLYAPAILALNVLLAGCVVMRNPEFPPEWAPLSSARIGNCPLIAGRYVNAGELYLTSGNDCSAKVTVAKAGDWNCSLALADNLGLSGLDGAAIVELRQPDGQTLEVALQDAANATLITQRLRLGHDFTCDADSMYFSETHSSYGGGKGPYLFVMPLFGDVMNCSRAFTGAAEGSLVMTVREQGLAVVVPIVVAGKTTSYVRWPIAPATAASEPP